MFDHLIIELDIHSLFPELTVEDQRIAALHFIRYLNYVWELAESLNDVHNPAGISDRNFLLNKRDIVGKEFMGEKLGLFPLGKKVK